jgi:hypothetical protein
MAQETFRSVIEPSPFRFVSTHETPVRAHYLRAGQLTQPNVRGLDRRSHRRIPYGRLLALTPVGDDSLTPCGELIYVVGKHLSPAGLDFYHHEPISQRFAVASLESGTEEWLHFLLKITWCRFLRANWYDSGGHFVKELRTECAARTAGS